MKLDEDENTDLTEMAIFKKGLGQMNKLANIATSLANDTKDENKAKPHTIETFDEETLVSMSTQEKSSWIEKIVDKMFMETLPNELRGQKDPKGNKKTHSELDKEIFLNLGENPMSKASNKYLFRLLQIFGFRDESLVSLIDKDHMKMLYLKSLDKQRFSSKDFFEQFSICYLIQNLSKFREQKLQTIHDFRNIVLSSNNHVKWKLGMA